MIKKWMTPFFLSILSLNLASYAADESEFQPEEGDEVSAVVSVSDDCQSEEDPEPSQDEPVEEVLE